MNTLTIEIATLNRRLDAAREQISFWGAGTVSGKRAARVVRSLSRKLRKAERKLAKIA